MQQIYQIRCWVSLTEFFPFACLVQGAVSGPSERSRYIRLGAPIVQRKFSLLHGWCRALEAVQPSGAGLSG